MSLVLALLLRAEDRLRMLFGGGGRGELALAVGEGVDILPECFLNAETFEALS